METAAVLTIRRAPEMTAKGRAAIAAWLRRQADMLVNEGDNYAASRFRARYQYERTGNRHPRVRSYLFKK